MIKLADTALLVADYDEALRFYVGILGFEVIEDRELEDKRWVRIKAGSAGLVLRRAVNDDQRAHIGNQTGRSVFLFLETDNFATTHAALIARGVQFIEPPRHEDYGTVAVFLDLYGNKLDLIEPRHARPRSTTERQRADL